jgi:A/G-specific adenine glycosylase
MMHPIAEKILRWYARHRRDLPWRKTRDPYAVWVSEVMLQQTQVDTVLPYYGRFLARFPTVQSLAAASLEEVLKTWENLGYYTRARHLHAAAREIVDRRQGVLPASEEELILLPGIGFYTAAAIASIAYGKSVPAVDGNVRRVLCRVFAVQTPLDHNRTQKSLRALAGDLIPAKDPGAFNQGLMDLGATLCTPRKPSCAACPLRELCLAAIKGLQETLPVKGKRRGVPHKEMIAAILVDGRERYLVVQRPASGLLGGLWGFPGGEKQPHQTLGQALSKTVRKNLGIRVTCKRESVAIKHAYTHFKITVHVYLCRIREGTLRPIGYPRWQWAGPEDLAQLPFSRVDRKILRALSITTGRR